MVYRGNRLNEYSIKFSKAELEAFNALALVSATTEADNRLAQADLLYGVDKKKFKRVICSMANKLAKLVNDNHLTDTHKSYMYSRG